MGRSRTAIVVCFGAVSAFATSCSQSGGCLKFCGPASYDMSITSMKGNLVSASDSCGQSAQCMGTSPCSALSLPPPPQGGDCQVTVTFSDGTTATVDANWGARSDDACCGTTYARAPQATLDPPTGPAFPADAGLGDAPAE